MTIVIYHLTFLLLYFRLTVISSLSCLKQKVISSLTTCLTLYSCYLLLFFFSGHMSVCNLLIWDWIVCIVCLHYVDLSICLGLMYCRVTCGALTKANLILSIFNHTYDFVFWVVFLFSFLFSVLFEKIFFLT